MNRQLSKLPAWFKANLGKGCLGVCTSYDWNALTASILIADAWGGADSDHKEKLAQAYGLTVSTLSESVQRLAYHGIAYPLDWGHRGQLWTQAELPRIVVGRCACE